LATLTMRGSLPVNAVGLFITKPSLDYEGASYDS
jgi:hypothetical protein